MRLRSAIVSALLVILVFACKTDRKNKNDDIAACNASGGQWVEGGCNDNGHCEKTTGIAPDDDDDPMQDEDMGDEGDELAE